LEQHEARQERQELLVGEDLAQREPEALLRRFLIGERVLPAPGECDVRKNTDTRPIASAIATKPKAPRNNELTESPTTAPSTPKITCHNAIDIRFALRRAIWGSKASSGAPERLLNKKKPMATRNRNARLLLSAPWAGGAKSNTNRSPHRGVPSTTNGMRPQRERVRSDQ
jgi:hypothetical protein